MRATLPGGRPRAQRRRYDCCMVRKLEIDELATEAGVGADLIAQLTDMGVLKPEPSGKYAAGDVIRLEAVQAFLVTGVDLDHIKTALAEGLFTFDYLDRFHPEPQPASGRTFAEFRNRLDASPSLLSALYLAMGLSEPGLDKPMRADEEQLIEDFLRAWSFGSDDETYLRAARLIGEPARRMAEGWTRLYVEKVSAPLVERTTTLDERIGTIVESTEQLSLLAPRLMLWLLDRHLRNAIDRANIEGLEQELVAKGLSLPPPVHPPAISFVDISGYTTLTEHHGDEAAAEAAALLRVLAERSTVGHGGTVVKMLGDGTMLHFPDVTSALAAVLELVEALGVQKLTAHAGIHAGTLIELDRDYFGRTVNLASRVAGMAGAGEVVVTDEVVAAAENGAYHFEALAPASLKGIDRPVPLFRVTPESA